MPACTTRAETSAEPEVPVTGAAPAGIGPVAESVHSVASVVPPSSLTTVLTSVMVGGMSSFVIVQVTSSPGPMSIVAPCWSPPTQTHWPAR